MNKQHRNGEKMTECTFELNGKEMSAVKCNSNSFAAFSGSGEHRNKKLSACVPNHGPIPTGVYYIIDRQSGGLLGPLRDLFTGRDQWLALYAIDEKIDDIVYCNKIKRGQFRMHPKGPLGRSDGCVVFSEEKDFIQFKSIIKNGKNGKIPGTEIEYYGRLTVK